jgi:hypothetical protein
MAVKRLVRRSKIIVRFVRLVCVIEGFYGGDVRPVVAAVYDRNEF